MRYLYPYMPRQTPNFKKQYIIIISLLAAIALLVCLRQSPALMERLYFGGLYKAICYIIRPLLNLLPFSFGDVLYGVIILLLLFGLVRLLRFLIIKQPKQAGKLALRFIICLQIGWLWFYCFWGLNYYRPAAAQLLGYNDTSYTIKDVAKVTELIIDSANTLRACLDSADMHQTNTGIYKNAVVAVNNLTTLSGKFTTVSAKIKPSMFSGTLNYLGTSGYYNPFTGEAQLNYLMPVFDKPFVACHEMGHQTGWAREDEANFAGYLAATNANDRMLRYSAYYEGISQFMRYLRRRDTVAHHNLRKKISPLVMLDFKTDSAYWTKYQGNAEVVSGIFYDKFLKANNQPHGLRTYNRMIILTMGYYKKRYKVW
jgi:hypothetical protein